MAAIAPYWSNGLLGDGAVVTNEVFAINDDVINTTTKAPHFSPSNQVDVRALDLLPM
jgi:hypothetical protein